MFKHNDAYAAKSEAAADDFNMEGYRKSIVVVENELDNVHEVPDDRLTVSTFGKSKSQSKRERVKAKRTAREIDQLSRGGNGGGGCCAPGGKKCTIF